MLRVLCCPKDGASLAVRPGEGVTCLRCSATYSTEGQVLRLGVDELHAESGHEMCLRDKEALEPEQPRWNTSLDAMESDATLEALALEPDHLLLELGAGRGRLTQLIEKSCARVVAVDMSMASLLVNARTRQGGRVTLVQADVTRPIAAPASFDRVLSTLTSNLPSSDARHASYRLAARALAPGGKFVLTTHYFGLRASLARAPKEGRYHEGGIYRYLLTAGELRAELAPHFHRVQVRPICVVLPLARSLRLPLVPVDRIARKLPGIRALGVLLLAQASSPRT